MSTTGCLAPAAVTAVPADDSKSLGAMVVQADKAKARWFAIRAIPQETKCLHHLHMSIHLLSHENVVNAARSNGTALIPKNLINDLNMCSNNTLPGPTMYTILQ